MVSFLEGVALAVRGAQCQLLRANQYVLGSLGRFGGPTRDRALDGLNAIGALLGCGGSPVDPPPPPFSGGQCDTLYFCEAARVTNPGFVIQATGSPLQGPITSAVVSTVGPGPGGTTEYRVVFTGANGTAIASDQSFEPSPGLVPIVRRVDNLPDNCGDPEGDFPDPVDEPIDIPVDYDDDDGNPINITIPFVFAPIELNFNGTLNIPFTFDFGGFEFSGDINFLPDAEITINPPGAGNGSGEDFQPVGEGDPEDEVDPTDDDGKIVGIVVSSQVNSLSGITDISVVGAPDIFAPRLGSIKFAYSFGGTTFWSNDIDVKGTRVFIPCPFSQGADAAVASPVPGVSMSFVEIRGYPLATKLDVIGAP